MTSVRFASVMTTALLAVSISLAGALQSQTGAANSGKTGSAGSGHLSAADKKFMMKAAQGGIAEVELGRLAMEHGGNEAVKQFGQRMVDDHTKANDELKQIASQKDVTLHTTPSQKDTALKNRLSKLSSRAFDKLYMSDMVKDHEHDVAEFEHEAADGSDPDVKGFAARTLPTLRMHLTMAKDVHAGKGMPK